MASDGRVAIVTGGAQGIGRGITQRLLREGWAVSMADIDEEAGMEAAAEEATLGPVCFWPTDVSDEGQVIRLIDETVARFGGLDLLVNNAYATVWREITEMTLEEWHRVIGVNLTGAFLCSRQALPHLRQRHGSIVNIASIRSFQSRGRSEAYGATKGALVSFTQALAISEGPEVRVNCVSPGWIETGEWQKSAQRRKRVISDESASRNPVGRAGTPDDIAAMVAYLASPAAAFITGQEIVVDGGVSRVMIV